YSSFHSLTGHLLPPPQDPSPRLRSLDPQGRSLPPCRWWSQIFLDDLTVCRIDGNLVVSSLAQDLHRPHIAGDRIRVIKLDSVNGTAFATCSAAMSTAPVAPKLAT